VITLRLGEIAAAVRGVVVGDPDRTVTGVVTDSRRASSEALFVALRGETADGHQFVAGAQRDRGAAALVERNDVLQDAGVVVEDCWQAIGALGAYVRTQVDPDVVAITGSVGKTTTKDLLRAVLAADRPTVAARGSFNNELGVPLTLLATEAGTRALIVEIGARGQGHIASLTPWVRPDVSIVTAVAGAHLEMFGDLDGVAAAKGELVAALAADGIAVLHADDPRVWAMRARTEAQVIGYGVRDTDVTVADARVGDDGRWSGRLVTPWGEASVTMPVPGRHNLSNALAAAAAAGALGVPLGTIVEGLAGATLSPFRAALTTRADGLLVVNDAYNANPFSMEAALDMLSDLRRPAGRVVAVLGFMAELGQTEVHDHEQIGARAGTVADLVVVVGSHPALAGMAAAAEATGVEVLTADAPRHVATALRGRLGAHDVVLCKGSRSAGLDAAAAALVADDTPRNDRQRPLLHLPRDTTLEAHP
jgi:UDP-N-acetylmuramoyl-tripeptide--D-alanyl-D-alanine ligase